MVLACPGTTGIWRGQARRVVAPDSGSGTTLELASGTSLATEASGAGLVQPHQRFIPNFFFRVTTKKGILLG